MNKSEIFFAWLSSMRPKTLPLAISAILVGAALANWMGNFDWVITGLALMTSVLLQVLSNFANDYGDHINQTDTSARIGPKRGIQNGNISPKQLKCGLMLMVALSLISGITLILTAYQSWQDLVVFLLLGGVAIIAAITYTIGRKPYGYLGLGDLSVLIFFGFLAVMGTFYLQAHFLPLAIGLPAFSCGLLAVAVLNINNLRDIEQDREVGKNTLIVRIGSQKGRIYHAVIIALAVVGYLIFTWLNFHSVWQLSFLFSSPFLVKHVLFVIRHRSPQELKPILGQMAILALSTNLMFSLGLCFY